MGLTNSSVGIRAAAGRPARADAAADRVVALAGNPNVGKSTVFNALTGMKQHTGNWPGKTVTSARGLCVSRARRYALVDLPGAYSLAAHSAEEEVARDFLCLEAPDAVVVVCDAACLERNLILVLQAMEVSDRVIVCANLLDEAKRRHVQVNLPLLSARLGVPVVGTVARQKRSLRALTDALDAVTGRQTAPPAPVIRYSPPVERAIAVMEAAVTPLLPDRLPGRWVAWKLLDQDEALLREIDRRAGTELAAQPAVQQAREEAQALLRQAGLDAAHLRDEAASTLVRTAESLCRGVVTRRTPGYDGADRRLDRLLTGRRSAYPIMIGLLAIVFWLTITGANLPSQLLAGALFWGQEQLTGLFTALGAPDWLHGALVLGVYRVVAWVVSVMLPPMAIFFPLFTLLEDAGYLPRIAYNLDKPFQRCRACGKQALTMCMGFGCNAAGIVGCRIIDSPRERLLAILTNNFVPCNGRFPTLIALLTMFFVGSAGGAAASLASAALLTAVIVLGVLITFGVTRLLSGTLLRGVPSSFTLELPPYRRPQLGKVIVRSIFDRTLFVLGRAVAVAAPAGLILWLMANVTVGDVSVLRRCAGFLDPFARLMGLDGVILIAFILGFPANEIVVPIILMAYTAQGSLIELDSLAQMKALLLANGWTGLTALCTMLFSLLHWPCSTALLTIRKETGSWKWTALAAALPTVLGIGTCMLVTAAARLF